MYYQKLSRIYKEANLQDHFPKISIEKFDEFIRNQLRLGSKFISPYKFAHQQNLTVKDSVQFFIYFTGEDGLFEISTYFDCSSSACSSTRVYVDLNDMDEKVICDECGKSFPPTTFKNYIKVLFKLKDTVSIPKEVMRIEKKDSTSTFEALLELPPHLKLNSPSSIKEPVEGDTQELGRNFKVENFPEKPKGVPIYEVIEANFDDSGRPISPMIERFNEKAIKLWSKVNGKQ